MRLSEAVGKDPPSSWEPMLALWGRWIIAMCARRRWPVPYKKTGSSSPHFYRSESSNKLAFFTCVVVAPLQSRYVISQYV